MKNTVFKSILALVMIFMALPMMGQNYLKIYFKDGHTERHFMHLVNNISMTKYDLEGNLHSDYQMQQIVMPDTTYSYYFADIDSMTFRKVDEEQVKKNVITIRNYVTPIFEQCSTVEEMEEHINEIKKIDGVEDVFRSGTEIIVKVRDWYDYVFMYPLVPEDEYLSLAKKIKSFNIQNIKPGIKQLKKDGSPIRIAVAGQMIHETRQTFVESMDSLRDLSKKLKDLGFEAHFIPGEDGGNMDIDFYSRRMFEYDHVILFTHGGYNKSSGLHTFLTDEYLGVSSEETLFWNWIYENIEKKYGINGIEPLKIDIEDAYIGTCRTGMFTSGTFIGVTEKMIGKRSSGFRDGTHIVFNGACLSLAGNGTLERHDGKTFPGSDAVAQLFYNKGADIYMGYNEECRYSGKAANRYFKALLHGLSHEKAFDSLDEGYKKETTAYDADLVDCIKKTSHSARSYFLVNTHTVEKSDKEISDEYDKSQQLVLKGLTHSYHLDGGGILFGFRIAKESDVDKLQKNQYQEYYSDNVHYTGTEVDQVEFSTVIKPEPGQTYYYRAFTYDYIHYNWGEEKVLKIQGYDNLSLSTNSASLKVGESTTIDITSGSGSYSIEKIEPSGVVTASISGNRVTIDAKTAGPAKITVKDDKSGQTAIIEVTVTDNLDPVSYLSCPDDHHPHMIDLGLPSGTMWACCNVDTDKPEGYGGYYAWGETEEKEEYTYNNYLYRNKNQRGYQDLGSDIAGTQYDVAHVKWGDAWCMPTFIQDQELVRNCSFEATSLNGVQGVRFIGENGASIFLPATESEFHEGGNYWASTPDDINYCNGLIIKIRDGGIMTSTFRHHLRYYGYSVRPVSVVKSLRLFTTALNLFKGNQGTVEITSGSSSYSIEKIEPIGVLTASVNGNVVTIDAKSEGTATITVMDNILRQTAKIVVQVTGSSGPDSYLACPDDHHPHLIDLGLPSGTKWACCNVGANTPEGNGGYYAWGETEYKGYYDLDSYKHSDGKHDFFDIGNDIAGTQYDVAHVKWGGNWCMPTTNQQSELVKYCSATRSTLNGVIVLKLTGNNGGSIFLPYSGVCVDGFRNDVGKEGYYWSSTIHPYDYYTAWHLWFNADKPFYDYDYDRKYGLSVRPVVGK